MGRLYVVATPIGNLKDISERALETLQNVSLVAAEDTRRTLQLLNYYSIKKPTISYHKHNEYARAEELIIKITENNLDIALVSDAGTPCISDPGCILISLAREKGIEVIAIPGASAAIAALSVSGFLYDHFSFLGFIPRDKKSKERYYEILKTSPINTFVLYEAGNRIKNTLSGITKFLPDCRVFIINDISKFHEKSYSGTISEAIALLEQNPNSELGEYTFILQRNNQETPASDPAPSLSIEALLVDEMIRSSCSLKEAIATVNNTNMQMSKGEIYKASLRLKQLL